MHSTYKKILKRPFVNLLYMLPSRARRFLFIPRVRAMAARVPVLRAVYSGWDRAHPLDVLYGTDTSGLVEADQLQADHALVDQLKPYMGSQPSIVRRALRTLPHPRGYIFIDLGCGKGRPMIVASEFAFDRVVGVDISADLVRTANQNAALIQARFPDRPPLHAVQGNAANVALPGGKLVIFLYNPFSAEIIEAVLRNLEAALEGGIEHAFLVYCNPVYGHRIDASGAFTRWFAQSFDYEPGEIGYGPDAEESVVIWQSRRGALEPGHAGRHRAIEIRMAEWSAGIAAEFPSAALRAARAGGDD